MSDPVDSAPGSCDRFEREGLLRLEQGRPLDAHFDTCADCRAARAEYERLHAGIHGLGRAHAGRGDWQARVWAGVARADERRPRRWWVWWLTAPLVAAAVALLVLVVSEPAPAGPALAYGFHRPGRSEAMRGEHAQPGDVLDVNIRTGGAAHAELRLYRDDRALLVRCTDQPPCARRGDDIAASISLDTRGRYQLVFLHGPQPLPAPGARLDDDLALARAAGATVALREIDVL